MQLTWVGLCTDVAALQAPDHQPDLKRRLLAEDGGQGWVPKAEIVKVWGLTNDSEGAVDEEGHRIQPCATAAADRRGGCGDEAASPGAVDDTAAEKVAKSERKFRERKASRSSVRAGDRTANATRW